MRPADPLEGVHGRRGTMRISGAIAQMRTTDVAESIRFYTTKVGLTLEFQYQDFYAGIRAGNQVFHLKLADERDPPSRSRTRANISTSISRRRMPRPQRTR